MGLLSSIKKAVTKVAIGAADVALNKVPAVFSHPITAITKGVGAAETKLYGTREAPTSLKSQATDVIKAGAAYGVAAVAGLTSVGRAVVAKVIPTTTKGKVIAAAAVPVAATAIINKPSLIVEAPSKILNFQSNVGEFIAEPSIQKAKDIATENPLITAAVGGAAAVAVGKTILPAIATYRQTEAIQEQTEAIQAATSGGITVIDKSQPIPISSIAPQTPVMPQTQTISAGGTSTSKRRKRRASKPAIASVNQKVNVIVNNRSSSVGIQNKRYLKEAVFA
jgi:hypothetical protein